MDTNPIEGIKKGSVEANHVVNHDGVTNIIILLNNAAKRMQSTKTETYINSFCKGILGYFRRFFRTMFLYLVKFKCNKLLSYISTYFYLFYINQK